MYILLQMSHYNFYKPTQYNTDTVIQLWTSSIVDSHDACCGCCKPITHLLQQLFPPDHKDRYLTIDEIIKREIKDSQCHFGGKEEKDTGEANADPGTAAAIKPKEEDADHISEGELEELLKAAAEDDAG